MELGATCCVSAPPSLRWTPHLPPAEVPGGRPTPRSVLGRSLGNPSVQPWPLETSRLGGGLASLSEMALVAAPGSRGHTRVSCFAGGHRQTVTTALSQRPLLLTLMIFYYGNLPAYVKDVGGVIDPLSDQLRQLGVCPLWSHPSPFAAPHPSPPPPPPPGCHLFRDASF